MVAMSEELLTRVWLLRRKRRNLIKQIISYYCWKYLIKQPSRTSALTGAGWVAELLNGNLHRRKHIIQMDFVVFRSLATELIQSALLQPTRNVAVDEQLILFLYFAGQTSTSRQMQE